MTTSNLLKMRMVSFQSMSKQELTVKACTLTESFKNEFQHYEEGMHIVSSFMLLGAKIGLAKGRELHKVEKYLEILLIL